MRCRLGYNLAISVIDNRYIYLTSSILKTLSTIYSLFCTDKVNLKTYKFVAVCAAKRLLYRALRLRLSSQVLNDPVSLEKGFWPTLVRHGIIKSVLTELSLVLKSATKFSAHVISCSRPTFITNLPFSPALRRRSISENCQCRYCFRICFLQGPFTAMSYTLNFRFLLRFQIHQL